MKLLARLRHPVLREWLLILAILWALVFTALRGDWFSRIDLTLHDGAMTLFARPANSGIALIGIDEPSLKQLGRWPWPRNIHATLINRLTEAGARVIVLDVILSETDKANGDADRILAAAIAASGRVILPVTKDVFDGRIFGEALPAGALSAAAARLAHIGLTPDADGVLRSVFLRGGMGYPRYDVSSLAALRQAFPADWPNERALPGELLNRLSGGSAAWRDENRYRIPFAGPPGHFAHVAYIDVLRADVPLAQFKDKIVFVGATAPSMRDEFPTPVSARIGAMPGIEVQANLLQGLMEGMDLRQAPESAVLVIACVLLLALMIAYLWLTPRLSLVVTLLAALGVLGAAMLGFRSLQIWLPPATILAAIALAYPLWSWRKLEATQRYFDAELARIAQEPVIVPQEIARTIAPAISANAFVPDVIESRIATLQATTQRLRNLNRFVADSLESLPDASLFTDANARVLLANSSADRMFRSRRRGADRQPDLPLEGRDLFELLAAFRHGDARSWRELWMDAYDETQTLSVEARNVDEREYLVRIAPSFSARGIQTGSILTLVDVTPLHESERRRDEALRFLSHDMRSPQASILTLLDMYQSDPQSIPVEKLTERVGRYARRTLNLADDFLRLAKAERVNARDFDPVDLAELLRDAAEDAWSDAKARHIRIDVLPEIDEAWMLGDRDLLLRALMNLLSNAIKYSADGTMVCCTLRGVAGELQLEVADQGYGISEQDMPRLFTRFTRLQHVDQPSEAGIGLGLVFVKTVIERHGGSIAVHSHVAADEADSHGTTFVLSLPAAEAGDLPGK